MKQFDIACPNCGGYLNMEIGERSFVCGYCRQKLSLSDVMVSSTSKDLEERDLGGEFISAFDKTLLKSLESAEIYKKNRPSILS